MISGENVDFSGLILGFASAALYYLGHTTVEGREPEKVNIPLAKQNMNIIVMLEEKTAGNLTDEELHLLREVLMDLRDKMMAVEKRSSNKPE